MTQDEFLERFSNAACHEDDAMCAAQNITNNDALQQAACKLEAAQQDFETELDATGFEWG